MNHDEKIVAIASRIEVDENTGKLFIVFEVIEEKYKQDIVKNWAQDIEYILVGKNLILND